MDNRKDPKKEALQEELEKLQSVKELEPLAGRNETIQKKFFTRRDLFLLLGLVTFIALLFFGRRLLARPGESALVTVVDGESLTIPLDQDEIYHIDARLPVTLEVKDGRIRFIDSQCPDLLCEGFGFISSEGEQATCMPAGVNVTIVEQ